MIKRIKKETVVKRDSAIELTSTGLSEGTPVEVIVLVDERNSGLEAAPSDDKKWADFYKNVVGMWKDDEDIQQVFAEIERDRRLDRGREIIGFDD